MERNTNSDEAQLTETELRNAGASATYIVYYQTAKRLGVETNSTRHAERVVRDEVSYSGGGFHEALWNAEHRWRGDNPYGADEQNKKILQEAGVYQSEQESLVA